MSAQLFIDLEKTNFRPKEIIDGKILWALDRTPKEIELTLGWRTEGSGTSDSMLVHHFSWNPNHSAGEQPFEIVLPSEPYSLEGRLIAVKWALELRAHRHKEPFIQEIVVSPKDQCIQLPHVEYKEKKKPKD